MTEDQLSQAKKLKSVINRAEKTLERVESLKLSWAQNGTTYFFSKSQLDEIPELIDIFNNVTETAKILLQKQLEKQVKKLTNEFEKL